MIDDSNAARLFQAKIAIVAGVLQASPIPWTAWGQVQLHLRDGRRYQGTKRIEVHQGELVNVELEL